MVDIHDDSATTHAGVPVTIDVLSNDTFSNSNKTLTATTDGQHLNVQGYQKWGAAISAELEKVRKGAAQ